MIPLVDLAAAHAELAGELDAVWKSAVANSAFVGGAPVARFEEAWAGYCGTKHAIGVGNGTDAIELMLRAAGIGDGDGVIVPTNTFVASVEAIVRVGAVPVFADVDPDTLLLGSANAERVVTSSTKAMLAVHLFGQCVDFDDLVPWCENRGIMFLEDAAQAHGASSGGRRAGSVGRAASFSFYPGKNLGALGDGGAVVTNDDEMAARIRSEADHGRQDDHYRHVLVGRNSRLDALQAAVLEVKLGSLDAWNARRRELWGRYVENLAGMDGVIPVETRPDTESVHHLAVLRVRHRSVLMDELGAQSIASGIHYPTPCHLSGAFTSFASDDLPIASTAASQIVSVPIYPQLSLDSVDQICEIIGRVHA